jgi:hypothetical protein
MNSLVKTAFIHIGTMKTGSTAIQNFLKINQDELKNHGFYHKH